MQGSECKDRNPHYSNKTGLKIQMIVDQLRTPLSIIVTNGTKSDYPNLIELFNGIMVDTVNMDTNNKILLADSSYEGLYNNYTISEKGYDVYPI